MPFDLPSGLAMCCARCGGATQVTETRTNAARDGLRRRRRCTSCRQVFYTQELREDRPIDPRLVRLRDTVRQLQAQLDDLPPAADWDDL